jgi:hypothetical protein
VGRDRVFVVTGSMARKVSGMTTGRTSARARGRSLGETKPQFGAARLRSEHAAGFFRRRARASRQAVGDRDAPGSRVARARAARRRTFRGLRARLAGGRFPEAGPGDALSGHLRGRDAAVQGGARRVGAHLAAPIVPCRSVAGEAYVGAGRVCHPGRYLAPAVGRRDDERDGHRDLDPVPRYVRGRPPPPGALWMEYPAMRAHRGSSLPGFVRCCPCALAHGAPTLTSEKRHAMIRACFQPAPGLVQSRSEYCSPSQRANATFLASHGRLRAGTITNGWPEHRSGTKHAAKLTPGCVIDGVLLQAPPGAAANPTAVESHRVVGQRFSGLRKRALAPGFRV